MDEQFDIAAKIRENREDYLATVFSNAGIIEGLPPEAFNLELLVGTLQEQLAIGFEQKELEGLEYLDLKSTIQQALETMYERKMEKIEPQRRNEIERILFLQTLDEVWREHLYQMDVLKAGIGLRGYNQKDPLTEYKKDSYHMFNEAIARIKHDSVKTLHTVRFRFEMEEEEQRAVEEMRRKLEEEAAAQMRFNREAVEANLNQFKEEASKKVARNDPCPCGSGKKYKNCCGKSGPKKGLVAEMD